MGTIFKQHFQFSQKLRVFGLLSFCIDEEEENFFKVNLNIDNSSDSTGEDEVDSSHRLKIAEDASHSSSPPTLPPTSISPSKSVNGHPNSPRKQSFDREAPAESERNRRKLRRPRRKYSHQHDSEYSGADNEEDAPSPSQAKKQKSDSSENLPTDSCIPVSVTSQSQLSSPSVSLSSSNLASVIAATQQASATSSLAITGPNGEVLGHVPHSSFNLMEANLQNSTPQNSGITLIQSSPFNSIRTGLNLSTSTAQGVALIGNLQTAQNSAVTDALLKQISGFKAQSSQQTMISTLSPGTNFGLNVNLAQGSPSVVATSTANIDMNAIAHALATNKLTASPGPIPGQIVLSCPRQSSAELSFLSSPVQLNSPGQGVDKPISLVTRNSTNDVSFPDEASIERVLRNLRQKTDTPQLKTEARSPQIEKQPLRTVTYANLDNRRFNTAQMFRPGDGIVETSGGTIIYESGLKAYRCQFCGKTFNRKFCRERHERLHTGQKPYDCLLCNLKFIRLEDRKRHLRSDQHIEAVAEKARVICAKSGGTWADEKAVIIRMLTEEFDRDSSIDLKDIKVELAENSHSDVPEDTKSTATDENNPLDDVASVKSERTIAKLSDSPPSTPIRLVNKAE
ncbi:hypothetical protein Ciccas_005819 [Cichlidogyrus casuarinus]|uniref:C2H2-type domain-containing protein n=1 Tax=Cichlidogyrus casuarinus TaxID=1844966 RepID=A0ABD2Q7M5_9PLAT